MDLNAILKAHGIGGAGGVKSGDEIFVSNSDSNHSIVWTVQGDADIRRAISIHYIPCRQQILIYGYSVDSSASFLQFRNISDGARVAWLSYVANAGCIRIWGDFVYFFRQTATNACSIVKYDMTTPTPSLLWTYSHSGQGRGAIVVDEHGIYFQARVTSDPTGGGFAIHGISHSGAYLGTSPSTFGTTTSTGSGGGQEDFGVGVVNGVRGGWVNWASSSSLSGVNLDTWGATSWNPGLGTWKPDMIYPIDYKRGVLWVGRGGNGWLTQATGTRRNAAQVGFNNQVRMQPLSDGTVLCGAIDSLDGNATSVGRYDPYQGTWLYRINRLAGTATNESFRGIAEDDDGHIYIARHREDWNTELQKIKLSSIVR